MTTRVKRLGLAFCATLVLVALIALAAPEKEWWVIVQADGTQILLHEEPDQPDLEAMSPTAIWFGSNDTVPRRLNLSEVDVSTTDDISRPVEEVEALFRTFAERVVAVT